MVEDVEVAGGTAVVIRAGKASTAEGQALVRDAYDNFRRLDIIVDSAGVYVTGHVNDTDTDAFQRQLDVKVRGVATTLRAAVPLMSDGGHIVSIGTMGALQMPFAGGADYVASKAAVAAYTRG